MIPRSIQHHPTPGKNFASGDLAGAKRLAVAMRRLTAGLFLAAWVPFGALAEDMTLTLADGVEMGLVWIGPGEFAMGGIRPLPHDSGGEKVKVRLSSGFYLGRTEITQQQWVSIMGSRPWEGRPHVVADPQRPAVFFSWLELQVFVERLSVATGQPLRLPTEAEWEYACRAGEGEGEAGELDPLAWYYDNTKAAGQRQAMPVASKRPNLWGLFDMRGNVWEWVADWYSPTYGDARVDAVSAEGVSADGVRIDPNGPARGSHRVKRGGSFYDFGESLHCGARDGYSENGRYINIGARIALDR